MAAHPNDKKLTVSNFPGAVLRIECHFCDHRRQCDRWMLHSLFGPDAELPDVIKKLALCSKAEDDVGECGIHCPDLTEM